MTISRIHSGSTDRCEPWAAVVRTARLDLVPVTKESLQCQVGFGDDMRRDLAAILDAEVTGEWPLEHWEPHVLGYLLDLIARDEEAAGWCRYLLLRQSDGSRVLIGSFGAGFPKAETGESEIGYGIAPSRQRQGFAPEAVMAMLPWLQARREIRAFVAQTFPELRGSIRVLEKCGFSPAGDGFEPGAVLFRKVCGSEEFPG